MCYSSSLFLWGFFDDTHSNLLSKVSLGLLGGSLGLSSLLLLSKLLLSDLLLLGLVDGFDQDSLVLELVTLSSLVEVVVDTLSDLLGLSVLSQESSQDSLSAHPLDLDWESGVGSTLSLSVAGVSALSLGLLDSLASGSGVHLHLSLHDESILHELSDVLSCNSIKLSFGRFN